MISDAVELSGPYAVQALGKFANRVGYTVIVFTENWVRPHAPRQLLP